MKQLQNGIYTFNTGERSWGEEVNQNFEALDNLISGVAGNNDKIELLSEKIQTNTDNFEQTKDDLIDNINNTKNGLQDQIDILNNNILTLKYKIDNMDIGVDSVKHAEEADVAKKLKKSLTIGNVGFNGETDTVVTIDGTPIQNSSNLINSNAVYDALELKQDKATTLSGYGITDAYTKTQIDNKISTIPTVNNATLTIQKNGTTVKTFTANSSTNVTCNIEIPTKVSDLTNDSNFLTSADISNKADKATTLSGYGIIDAYTKTQVDTKISDLVNSAPETLDTLNELASALGDDPNFATTVANQIGTKANDSDVVHKSGDETIAGSKTFSSQIKGNISGTSSDVVVGSDTATARGYLVDNVLPRYTWEEGSQLIAGRIPLITDFNNLTKPGVYHVVFCLNDGYVHEEKEYKESLNRPSIPNITTGFRDGILEIKETTTMYNITSYHRCIQKLTLLSGNSNHGFIGQTYQRVCVNLSNNAWTAWERVARDEEVVHKSGDESIGGAKTFTDNVTCASSLILNGYVCTIE